MSEQPLTRNQLQIALKSRLFGCGAKRVSELRKKILVRLLEQKRLYEHPPTGRRRLSRFGIRPPALEPYFQKVKEDIRHVYPSQMPDGERCNMVTDGHGNYYMGVVLRN
jgi:hypothetical protein